MKPMLALFGAGILAFVVGCNTGPRNASTALGLQDSATLVSTADQRLDNTLQSLNVLLNAPQPELRDRFARFDSNLEELSDTAADIRSASLEMQVRGASYFESWNQELMSMNSPDIRESSIDRRNEVQESFAETASLYRQTNQELSQFVGRLRDIRAHLQTDLTSAGVDAIRGEVSSLNDEIADVQDSLNTVVNHFQDLGADLPARYQTASAQE